MNEVSNQMKNFDIWSEGYQATGQSSGAHYHGSCSGETFKDACINFARNNPEFASYFNVDRMSFWGCKLFDNATDARASFG